MATVYRLFERPLLLLLRLVLGPAFLTILSGLATMGISAGVAPPQAWALLAISVCAAIWVAKQLSGAIQSGGLSVDGFHREWAAPTYHLVKFLLFLFGLVVAFPYLPGGESPALKGASIFIGVLVTRIRTIKNVEVILPNSSVLGGHILNYSAHTQAPGLILHSTITIGYNIPWPTVHELLIQSALRTSSIPPEPRPFVLQTSLNDSHISYQINAYTAEVSRMAELHKNIQDEFSSAGVEIMSPMYLAVRDGNSVTTPANIV